ncbi:MAG: hypothetical protein K2R98_14985 [Gemmataceae bacterium]|nr:hypothetical protein [Gemmataceae bacterium]
MVNGEFLRVQDMDASATGDERPAVGLGTFVTLWNSGRFTCTEDARAFLGGDGDTLAQYRRAAERAGYRLGRLGRLQEAADEGDAVILKYPQAS